MLVLYGHAGACQKDNLGEQTQSKPGQETVIADRDQLFKHFDANEYQPKFPIYNPDVVNQADGDSEILESPDETILTAIDALITQQDNEHNFLNTVTQNYGNIQWNWSLIDWESEDSYSVMLPFVLNDEVTALLE